MVTDIQSRAKTTPHLYKDQISIKNDEPNVKRPNGTLSSKYLFPTNLFLHLCIASRVLTSALGGYTTHVKHGKLSYIKL